MAENTTNLQTWDEFLQMDGSKEEKLAALKKNQKLLFSNPGALRKQLTLL